MRLSQFGQHIPHGAAVDAEIETLKSEKGLVVP
jgi:hypothetical protein